MSRGWHPGMSFSPGVNAVSEPMLFGGPVCAVCGAELAWAGKGRRSKYCSKKCSSKADRAREKEKQEQALTVDAERPGAKRDCLTVWRMTRRRPSCLPSVRSSPGTAGCCCSSSTVRPGTVTRSLRAKR